METKTNWCRSYYDALTAQNSDAVENRNSNFEAFLKDGWPRKGTEEWKYTSFDKIRDAKVVRAPEVVVEQSALEKKNITYDGFDGTLVFVNGRLNDALSRRPEVASVSVSGRAEVTVMANDRFQAFGKLNAALSEQVVHVKVARGALSEKPLQLVFVSVAEGEGCTATFPHVDIEIEESAEYGIVEQFVGDGQYFVCGMTRMRVKSNAQCTHLKLQRDDNSSFHWHNLLVDVERDARCKAFSYSFGSGVVRNEVNSTLQGTGCWLELYGLSLCEGNRHVDNATVIDHAYPHCESREIYKGIYADKSSGAFSGTIIVRPDAQKTNAVQSNQGLLLSDTAIFNTRPQLKIWADDVKCTHGATVGQLDENALFYLRSRGIPQKRAMALLTQAFAQELVDELSNEGMQQLVQAELESALQSIWNTIEKAD